MFRRRDARYYKKHREEILKRDAEYRRNHREEIAKRVAEYRKNHREEILKREAEYRKTHREELRKRYAEYYRNHREEKNRKTREYARTHKEQINRRRRNLRIKKKLIAENTITPEWQKVLDELDREMYLNDCRQNRLRDPGFDRRLTRHYYNHEDRYSLDPWNMVYNSNDCVETTLFPESEPVPKADEPEIAHVRRIIEEKCTETERKLIDLHFGDGMKLVDIGQIEATQTGKEPTVRALSMRKRRLLDKVAKHLGVKHESRWIGPKSKQHGNDEGDGI